uniref:Uncharacterized protein n=1 Tax=viral metagenome TaxID=1070528 RepID=A0A6M3J107_9ZZZZ
MFPEWTLLDPIESNHLYDGGEAMAREIENRLKAELGEEVWDMLSIHENIKEGNKYGIICEKIKKTSKSY